MNKDWDTDMLYNQHNFVCTLMYAACLCPNLVSVHFYAIPIKFSCLYFSNNSHCILTISINIWPIASIAVGPNNHSLSYIHSNV